MPDYSEKPSGFSAMTPDSLDPLSTSYPVKISGLMLFSQPDKSGNLLVQYEMLNGFRLRLPSVVSFRDYYPLQRKRTEAQLWQDKVASTLFTEETKSKESSIELIGADIAGQRVSLRVMGNISISGRLNNQTQATQITNFNQTNTSNFILDQTQNFNIEGRIGDRLSIKVDQDSERDFNFENTLKIFYTGQEDEIVQRIDAGNIDLSLSGTQFVTGKANTSGLFGIKALLKIGPVDLTAIASVEEGQNKKTTWGGGSDSEPLKIKDHQYLRNKYFFINKEFRNSMYPLDDMGRFVIHRQVREFELYKNVPETEVGAFTATAWIDPNDTTAAVNDFAERNLFFKRLERDVDYELNENLGYFKMMSFVNPSDVIAIAYRDESVDPGSLVPVMQEGDLISQDSTVKNLKLIKPQNPQPKNPTWDLEFKNVYSLGTTNINAEGFDLKIYNSSVASPIDRDENGTYLRTFGLDNQDENGVPGVHDEIMDNNPAVLRMNDGELWFPYLEPFTSEKTDPANAIPGEFNPDLPEALSSHFLYDTTSTSLINSDSKFYIQVKYTNRSSEIQLADPMIIEGSEEITAGGVLLTRGVDYTIDYFTGHVSLITPEARNPSAALNITYNARTLFQLDKKTVAGVRAEYKFGDRNFLGSTFMYYNQSSIDDQVRVGEEPFRNMIWDINGNVGYDINWLTRAINALPLIETSDPSSIKVSGEIAQILPNPNTINNPDTGDPKGVANIDDFEGAKQTTPMGVEKNGWFPASRPVNDALSYDGREQGFLFWYNPWGDIPTRQIWPDKQTSSTMNNDVTRVLNLVLDPTVNGITGQGTGAEDKKDVWGGVMRPLYSGAWDQSESKYIEVWARGTKGILQLDLGKISEDLDLFDTTSQTIRVNHRLDTEDKPIPGTGMTTGNGILETSENIGINGLTDEQEIFYGIDPELDNYKYDQGSRDYRHANGEERNNDYFYPNTEDISNNGKLDYFNSYFSYEINLANSDYFITETEFSDGKPTGWKLYRIPLSLPVERVNSPAMTDIQIFRLIYTGCADQDTVQIAGVGLVGNEWQEIGIAADSTENYVVNDNVFKIAVVNTEDNPEYDSPRGVMGKLDPVYNVRAKEQSLAMRVQDLSPGTRTAAKKSLWDNENYMNYQSMKMFVHGDVNYPSDSTQVKFYIRMGNISGVELKDYYEIVTPVFAGWDTKNFIDLQFNDITRLKQLVVGDSINTFVSADGQTRMLYLTDESGERTGRTYKVVGSPSFSRVNYFVIGLINDTDRDYTGEVWINELRVSDPLIEKGIAFRGAVDMDIAGIASINVNGNYKDASFHQVNQQYSTTGNTDNLVDNKSVNVNIKMNPHKLLPKSWSLSMPVSLSYSDKQDIPIYVPGSDIRLSAVPDSLLRLNHSIGLSTSFKKTSKSDFWLSKYTIDRLGANFSYARTNSSDRTIRDNHSTAYKGGVSYSLNFPKGNGISYLSWIPFYGDNLESMKFYLIPSNFSYNINMNEDTRFNQPRRGASTSTYKLNMSQSTSLSYSPFDNLTAGFKRATNNNLDSLRYRKTDIIRQFDTGFRVGENENYSLNFNPKFGSVFAPRLSYTSAFRVGNTMSLPYSSTSNSRNASASFDLDPAKVFNAIFKGKDSNRPNSRPDAGRGRPSPRPRPGSKKPEKTAGKKEKKEFSLVNFISSGLGRIQPLSFNMSENRSLTNQGVVLGDSTLYRAPVNFLYRLGLSDTPSDSIAWNIVGNNASSVNTKRNLSVRSGIKIFNNITSSFNFKYDQTENNSGNNVMLNTSRGFLPLGETGSQGIPMVDWSLKWSGLNKLPFVKDYVKSLTLDHAYNGQETISKQNGEVKSFTYSMNFMPLIGLGAKFNNGISSELRYSLSHDIVNQNTDTRKTLSENGTFTITYSKKGGLHIPIPFLEDLNMQNTIDFSMNANYSTRSVYLRKIESGSFVNTDWNKSWKLRPVVNYQFSKNINGSVFYEYGETSTPLNPKRINRDFGLSAKIRISG